MKTTHEILVEAKAALLKHGWCKGSLYENSGAMCLRGALWMPIKKHYEFESILLDLPIARWKEADKLLREIEKVLGFTLGFSRDDYSYLPIWNDAPERTFEDVIARLDKAILATAPKEDFPPADKKSAELVSV